LYSTTVMVKKNKDEYILHHLRDKVRKSWFFHTPLHSTIPLGGGGPRRNIVIPFSVGNLEWWGYSTVKKFEDMYNRLHSIPACDGRRAVKSSNF